MQLLIIAVKEEWRVGLIKGEEVSRTVDRQAVRLISKNIDRLEGGRKEFVGWMVSR